jgi:hypothetical protein
MHATATSDEQTMIQRTLIATIAIVVLASRDGACGHHAG